MPLIFSPLTEDILEGPFEAKPRHAFLMLHSGEDVSDIERSMEVTVSDCLENNDYKVLKATTQRGTKDYLDKIIKMIRGCGFCIAIFSEHTPASTMANIFFEAGIASVLGKPVIVIQTEGAKAPSDFVRNEWIVCDQEDFERLEVHVKASLDHMEELADYFYKLGDLSLEAEDAPDLENAFERYKQAVLISGHPGASEKLGVVLDLLKENYGNDTFLATYRARLKRSVDEFLMFLPAN